MVGFDTPYTRDSRRPATQIQGIQNQDLMDKKRVDVAVRDQKSTSGRVWARMVHSMPTRKSPALDADVEAAARLV